MTRKVRHSVTELTRPPRIFGSSRLAVPRGRSDPLRANRATSRVAGFHTGCPNATVERWQAYCFAYGMSDHAYDISHLLDLDTFKDEPATLRIVRTPPPSQQAAPSVPKATTVAEAQEALAKELMGAAAIHEALIHQYLSYASEA